MFHNERDTAIYGAWREAVLERDGYTCQECESTKNLEAHHKKRFKNNPEARFDLANGTTLCEKCHKKKKGHKEGEWNKEEDENEGIFASLQYKEPRRYYENQPRTIWKDYYRIKKIK